MRPSGLGRFLAGLTLGAAGAVAVYRMGRPSLAVVRWVLKRLSLWPEDTETVCWTPMGVAVLSAATWRGHILRRHPELADTLDWVELTLETPDGIYRDAVRADRRAFYRAGGSPNPQLSRLKVVVEVQTAAARLPVLRVITAYASRNVKLGEVQLWP